MTEVGIEHAEDAPRIRDRITRRRLLPLLCIPLVAVLLAAASVLLFEGLAGPAPRSGAPAPRASLAPMPPVASDPTDRRSSGGGPSSGSRKPSAPASFGALDLPSAQGRNDLSDSLEAHVAIPDGAAAPRHAGPVAPPFEPADALSPVPAVSDPVPIPRSPIPRSPIPNPSAMARADPRDRPQLPPPVPVRPGAVAGTFVPAPRPGGSAASRIVATLREDVGRRRHAGSVAPRLPASLLPSP